MLFSRHKCSVFSKLNASANQKNTKNLNIGESRNVGIRLAKGEYLAFCDHDDIVLPEMYEQMYNIGIKENADIVLGVPEYTYIDSSMNHTYFYRTIY